MTSWSDSMGNPDGMALKDVVGADAVGMRKISEPCRLTASSAATEGTEGGKVVATDATVSVAVIIVVTVDWSVMTLVSVRISISRRFNGAAEARRGTSAKINEVESIVNVEEVAKQEQ